MEIIAFIVWIGLCFAIASAGGKRNIGWGVSFIISLLLSPLVGLIVVLFSDKKNTGSLKWKAHAEAAKKAEFKGNVDEAISNYMDAMYHLQNDYHNLSRKDEEIRTNRLNDLRNKVEELKTASTSNL